MSMLDPETVAALQNPGVEAWDLEASSLSPTYQVVLALRHLIAKHPDDWRDELDAAIRFVTRGLPPTADTPR